MWLTNYITVQITKKICINRHLIVDTKEFVSILIKDYNNGIIFFLHLFSAKWKLLTTSVKWKHLRFDISLANNYNFYRLYF